MPQRYAYMYAHAAKLLFLLLWRGPLEHAPTKRDECQSIWLLELREEKVKVAKKVKVEKVK